MEKTSKIFVAGSKKLIGGAIKDELLRQGYTNIIQEEEPDLTDRGETEAFFSSHTPEYVFMAAGQSASILNNQKFPADLMLGNMQIACNALESAYRYKVKKLLYMGSSCCYPRECPQPMTEDLLLTGSLEPTSQPYAVAKLAGMELCRAYRRQYGANFIVGIPATVFGPRDKFDLQDSHVLTAQIRKFHDAKEQNLEAVELWGTGKPRREFIFVDDLGDACITVMKKYDSDEPINLGVGSDISIAELASAIKEMVGYGGDIRFDTSKKDGAILKLLDSTKLFDLDWRPRTPLAEGIQKTYYEGYLKSFALLKPNHKVNENN